MPRASGQLTIRLDALASNYTFLTKQAPGAKVAGVVKAGGYGLGIGPVAETLSSGGCEEYFVATLQEGIELRSILPKANIAILGGLFKGAEDLYNAHNLTPVINSMEELSRIDKQTVILHIDTAMNRLGIKTHEASKAAQEGKNIHAIMTHFACADEHKHPLNALQYQRFMEAAAHFPDAQKSLCNSAGMFLSDDYHLDIARPGMALYGLNPTPHTDNPMRHVVELEAQILQIHDGRKDESAGYGASHVFDDNTPLATVAIGYADGFHRALSGKGKLYYQGQPCPIIGRVSMDTTIINLSGLEDMPKPGDMIEILGSYQSADEIADNACTIGYEVLTNLGARWQRIYA